MHASRALRSIAFVVGTIAAGGASAATPALVVDVDSGKVLYAERATDPWFPASITKLMTAYVALSAVQERKLTLDTLLTVSENAASQPPSKIAFRPGTEITLDNALKIIMVKSANDVATVIAEGIGGSVEGFAKMMNDAAWRIGMRESRWTNPHGLPDSAQYTSARDMAVLGRALLRDFPEHRGLFQLSAIKLGRRVMANHNGLIGRYPGADGMKTGFICSSGFNVVASATRDGRRLITVVMGSRNASERTIKAADLFDRGFATSSFFSFGGRTLEDLPGLRLDGRAGSAAGDLRRARSDAVRGGCRQRAGECLRKYGEPERPVHRAGLLRPSPSRAAASRGRASSVRARLCGRSRCGPAAHRTSASPTTRSRRRGGAAARGERRSPRRRSPSPRRPRRPSPRQSRPS